METTNGTTATVSVEFGTVMVVGYGSSRRLATVTAVRRDGAVTISSGHAGVKGSLFKPIGGGRWSRSTGSRSRAVYAHVATPDEVVAIEAAEREAKAAADAEREARREAVRGRMTGYLIAASHALESQRQDDDALAGVASAAGRPSTSAGSRRRLLDQLLGDVWSARTDLERAESDVRSAANTLRRLADELTRDVDDDGAYGGVSYPSAAGDAYESTARRRAARDRAERVLGVVAAFLDVDVTALVAPMMRDGVALK